MSKTMRGTLIRRHLQGIVWMPRHRRNTMHITDATIEDKVNLLNAMQGVAHGEPGSYQARFYHTGVALLNVGPRRDIRRLLPIGGADVGLLTRHEAALVLDAYTTGLVHGETRRASAGASD